MKNSPHSLNRTKHPLAQIIDDSLFIQPLEIH